ncbi:hypothetical protein RFI_16885 [Reticulomyxa filosa]|uniref:Uncharacterized protein n=1 Tax=Reticulomyxa filosa TaxID=46433 RepID=X6N2M9_RETFI|nr:hypothetical protein RFI_16885 [Reticulomyxa filosa]|eukprot:ETO20331.1 hypothetical protein RFI_16885 [Reticulomyxa filosa]
MSRNNQGLLSDKLARFLHERPVPQELVNRNIMYNSPTDYDSHVEQLRQVVVQRKEAKEKKSHILDQKLSWKFRARPEELLGRGIVTMPIIRQDTLQVTAPKDATDAQWIKLQDKKRKSASLKARLLHRPSPNEIIKQGIISATDVNQYVQPLEQHGTKEELDRLTSELEFEKKHSKLLGKRVTMLQEIRNASIASLRGNTSLHDKHLLTTSDEEEDMEEEEDDDDDDDEDEDDEDDAESTTNHKGNKEHEKRMQEDLMMIDAIQTKLSEWDTIQYDLDNWNLELAEIETENTMLDEQLEGLMFELEMTTDPIKAQKKNYHRRSQKKSLSKKERKMEKYKRKIMELTEEVQRLQSEQIGFVQRTMDQFNFMRDTIKRLSK